jgi:hypothetical protein
MAANDWGFNLQCSLNTRSTIIMITNNLMRVPDNYNKERGKFVERAHKTYSKGP